MGSLTPTIPSLDLTKGAPNPGSEEWTMQCRRLREALESHGSLLLSYDHESLREEMLTAMQTLFCLPAETKRRNASPSPYYTHVEQNIMSPYYESLAVINADTMDVSRSFTDLMWPDGNHQFCKIMNSMSKMMVELAEIIMRMIFDSYGLASHCGSHIEGRNGLFRMLGYRAPNCKADEPVLGLVTHTDASYITLLSQLNGVHGLTLKNREGEWFQVNPPPGSFILFVGDALQAWSNGRLHCPPHRVVFSGDMERFCCGLFLLPKEEQVIEAPAELVDEEHPRLYKPFKYIDFVEHSSKTYAPEGKIDLYAGVDSTKHEYSYISL